MNGIGYAKNLKKCDFWAHKPVDNENKDKYISIMKELIKSNPAVALMMTPVIAYSAYRLALEAWCVAYGLIY